MHDAVDIAGVHHYQRQGDEQAVAQCLAGDMPQAAEIHGAQHREGHQKAEGVQAQRRHVTQAQVGEEIGRAPEGGDHHQQKICLALLIHAVSPPEKVVVAMIPHFFPKGNGYFHSRR